MPEWQLYSVSKPRPWRRVQIKPGTLHYAPDEFGLVTDLSYQGDYHKALVFHGDSRSAPGCPAWSHDGRRGVAHGHYFGEETQWRYLRDTKLYRDSTTFQTALFAQPSIKMQPDKAEGEELLLSLEEALREATYMASVINLSDEPDLLSAAWDLYMSVTPETVGRPYYLPDHRGADFAQIVSDETDLDCTYCEICRLPVWRDDCLTDVDGNDVCEPCRADLSACGRCEDWSISEDFLYWVDDSLYCETCRDRYMNWCEDCDEYYHPNNSSDHDHSDPDCVCEPQDLRFQILANSHGEVGPDERILVELPEGMSIVTDEAVQSVISMLWYEQLEDAWRQDPEGKVNFYMLTHTVEALERVWQTKRGNYTKRLSAAMYKELGVKLNVPLLSRVGSTIKAHFTPNNKWYIEFTRNLNQSAEAFYHDGSCWWGSESISLCALKNWGGLAMRSYYDEHGASDDPNGRAWIQPLNAEMKPTNDIYNAHAYVVYNGYGELAGFTAARIVAYMTSRSYRKIGFEANHQYVNSSAGYLIADQATCDNTEELYLNPGNHHMRIAA